MKRLVLVAIALAVLCGSAGTAQARRSRWTYDIDVGPGLNFAGSFRVAGPFLLGLGLGVGGSVYSWRLAADARYPRAWVVSPGDYFDLAQFFVFVRFRPSRHLEGDIGLRTSAFLENLGGGHPWGGVSFGGFADLLGGFRHFKIGGRLGMDVLHEPGPGYTGYAVVFFPIVIRISF